MRDRSSSWKVVVLGMAFVAALAAAVVADAASPSASSSAVASTSDPGVVNINTAGVADLASLAGIGRKVAEKIVEYREAHGPFKKPEEIRRVQGVGAGLWEKNRSRIVVK